MTRRGPGGWGGLVVLLAVALSAGDGGAHAFPERSEPRVGATLRTAPARVQIWFDGDLEPAFSRLAVTDARGARVDRGDGAVDPQNRRVLRATLPPIPPGTYKVSWGVLSVDGHRTEGDYAFTLKPAE
jgi:methionine-rich copper-binding protein CopC